MDFIVVDVLKPRLGTKVLSFYPILPYLVPMVPI